jgi:hypothetical protein
MVLQTGFRLAIRVEKDPLLSENCQANLQFGSLGILLCARFPKRTKSKIWLGSRIVFGCQRGEGARSPLSWQENTHRDGICAGWIWDGDGAGSERIPDSCEPAPAHPSARSAKWGGFHEALHAISVAPWRCNERDPMMGLSDALLARESSKSKRIELIGAASPTTAIYIEDFMVRVTLDRMAGEHETGGLHVLWHRDAGAFCSHGP